MIRSRETETETVMVLHKGRVNIKISCTPRATSIPLGMDSNIKQWLVIFGIAAGAFIVGATIGYLTLWEVLTID